MEDNEIPAQPQPKLPPPKAKYGRPQKGVRPAMAINRNPEETAKRRAQVRDFVVRGFPPSTIARVLGVHKKTVERDIKLVQKNLLDGLKKKSGLLEVAEMAEFFDAVARAALSEAARRIPNGKDGPGEELDSSDKNSLWNTALRAKSLKVDLYLRCGAIPCEGKGLNEDSKPGEVSGDKVITKSGVSSVFKDPGSRRKVIGIFEKLLKMGGREASKIMQDKDAENAKPAEIEPEPPSPGVDSLGSDTGGIEPKHS